MPYKKPGIDSFATSALPVGSALLAVLYLAHTVLYLVGVSTPDGGISPTWLALVTGGTALIFAVISYLVRRQSRDTAFDDHIMGACSLLVLANITVHFAVSNTMWHGYDFVLYLIAIGAVVVSTGWFIALLLATLLVAFVVTALAIDVVEWSLFGVLVVLGAGASSLLHITRVLAFNKLKDISARAEKAAKNAEEALATSRTRAEQLLRAQGDLQGILDKSPEVIVIHRDGLILYANPALLDCLRLDGSEVIGSSLSSVLADEQEIPRGPSRCAFRRHDGERVIVQLAAPVEVQYDMRSASLLTGRDITVQDADLQAKLLLADRMAAIGLLSAGVAHEINNPLSYVLANLEALEDNLKAHQQGAQPLDLVEAAELVNESLHGGRRVADIVRALNVMARPELSKNAEAEATTVLATAIESAAKMIATHLRHKSIELLVDIPSDLPVVRGSSAGLSQVFLNLLMNAAQACDASKAGNQIRVRARQVDTSVVVDLVDSGSGMSKETQRRLFDPFYTTKAIGEGTGLGLYFCHNEMASCGGTIHFESELGVGTRFEIRLQLASAPLDKSDEPASRVELGKVLIVDDDEHVSAALRRIRLRS